MQVLLAIGLVRHPRTEMNASGQGTGKTWSRFGYNRGLGLEQVLLALCLVWHLCTVAPG